MLVKLVKKVALLFLMINKLRSDGDEVHEVYYDMAVELAKGGGVKPFKKRTGDRQMQIAHLNTLREL